MVTIKDLFEVFREVGQVFDVFLPKDRLNGRGRGFGFVRFKTEWHANRAIRSLNGRMVGGRRIGEQKAKYVDRNSRKTCYSLAVKSTRKAFSAVSLQNQGVNSTYPPKASHGKSNDRDVSSCPPLKGVLRKLRDDLSSPSINHILQENMACPGIADMDGLATPKDAQVPSGKGSDPSIDGASSQI
ncbi:hypothetical protein AAC387_Pa02g2108 [Persea americana]